MPLVGVRSTKRSKIACGTLLDDRTAPYVTPSIRSDEDGVGDSAPDTRSYWAGLFPASPRVIYGRPPLRSVVCQLRFPTVLRIETTVPADFQDSIRQAYPLYERGNLVGLPLPIEQIPSEVQQLLGASNLRAPHVFKSADGASTIQLLPDSITLTTTKYERWEFFRRSADAAVNALIRIYSPSFVTRVGLRYTNVVLRSEANVEGQEWTKLLDPR